MDPNHLWSIQKNEENMRKEGFASKDEDGPSSKSSSIQVQSQDLPSFLYQAHHVSW